MRHAVKPRSILALGWFATAVLFALTVAPLLPPNSDHGLAASPPAELASVSSQGAVMPSDDYGASISDDGRIVAFTANPPTAGKFPTDQLVWVRDRATSQTVAAPLPPGGQQAIDGALSGDGCHLAYWVQFDAEDGVDWVWRLYRWDRCTNTDPVLVSATVPEPDFFFIFSNHDLAISTDGRYIAYLVDFDSEEIPKVARVDTSTTPPSEVVFDGDMAAPYDELTDVYDLDMSDNGQFVAVSTEYTTSIVDPDPPPPPTTTSTTQPTTTTTGGGIILRALRHLPAGALARAAVPRFGFGRRVSVVPPMISVTLEVITGWEPASGDLEIITPLDEGALPSYDSRTHSPSLSADARYVAFVSSELDADEEVDDLFVKDRFAGSVVRLTSVDDTPGLRDADDPSLTPDGTTVAFERDNAAEDTSIYLVRSISELFQQREVELVSFGVNDTAVDGAFEPAISATGRYIAFSSPQGAALTGQSTFPASEDVWIRERPPALTATPAIDFGLVPVGGSSAPSTVTVTNTSKVLVPITAVLTPGAPFTVTADACGGVVLRPGDTCTITLTFNPPTGGGAASTLDIVGDGSWDDGATATVALTGVGDPPPGALSASPAMIDFGTFDVGTALTPQPVTITNTGGKPMTVTSASVTGAAFDQFGIVGGNCPVAVIAPGQFCTIDISASVTRDGPSAAILEVGGDNGQTVTVGLTVTGVTPPPTTTPPVDTTSPTTTTTTTTTTTRPPSSTTTTLPVFTPTLRMVPGVVRPGEVTSAIGEGFPPNTPIALAFVDEFPFAVVTSDAAGALHYDLFFIRNGVRIGGTEIVAIDQPQFTGVRAPLLIELASFQPSGVDPALAAPGVRAMYGRGG